MKFKCLVIDDMQDSIDVIASHIKRTPELELLATETDIRIAQARITSGELKPDIIFLDIKMPEGNGIAFARLNNDKSAIIFITGHRDFGPEAYELGAADYKMKPIFYNEFLTSVERAKSRWCELNKFNFNKQNPVLYVPGSGKTMKIRIIKDELIYMQGQENYSFLYVGSERILSYVTLSRLEELLPMPHFVRIQKSYIVNVSKITRYNANTIFLNNGVELPIGTSYRSTVEKVLLFTDFRSEHF